MFCHRPERGLAQLVLVQGNHRDHILHVNELAVVRGPVLKRAPCRLLGADILGLGATLTGGRVSRSGRLGAVHGLGRSGPYRFLRDVRVILVSADLLGALILRGLVVACIGSGSKVNGGAVRLAALPVSNVSHFISSSLRKCTMPALAAAASSCPCNCIVANSKSFIAWMQIK